MRRAWVLTLLLLLVPALTWAQPELRTGAKGTTPAANLTSTAVDANTQALDVSVAGTVTVFGPLTDTQLRAAPVPMSLSGSVAVTGTFWQATQPVSGTFWQATQPVSGTFWQATQPVSGTFWQATQPISGTVTANAGTGTRAVAGDVAHDAADSGNPIKVGYKAIAHGTNPTAVAAADRTDAYANRAGIPFTLGGHPNAVTLEAAYTAAQTDTAIITIAAGLKIVVTQIQMTADNANTVDVGFRVGFGATTTPTTTGVVATHPGVAAGSGISRGDGSGILGIGADNEDLRITSEIPTTGSIRILVTYFTIES